MNKIVALAEKNLSNNFLGKGESSMNTVVATANSFSVDISNNGTVPINIALVPGHYPVTGVSVDSLSVPSLHYHNISELSKAGIAVQAVMDDGDQVIAGAGTITCNPLDPTYTVRSFLEYIKTFSMVVSQISLRSPLGTPVVFNNTLKLSRSNPFFRTEEIPVKTGQFFNVMQVQDNRIDISMLGTGLELTKDLVMILTIPAKSTIGVDLMFAN